MESNIMKNKVNRALFWGSIVAFAVGIAIILEGCAAVGPNPTPPTKAESLIYETKTNYVPVVVPSYVTNQVQVQTFQTNVQGVVVTQYLTNVVPVTVPAQTNLVPSYTQSVKPSVTAGVQGAGGILNTFFPGIGSIALNLVLAALGGWGYLRSSKLSDTSAALAQEIEVIRNVIKSVPNGAAIDAAFVQFIQNHQADAGVLTQVLNLLASKLVSNKDAKTAAEQIAATVQALTNSATATTKA